MSDNEELLYVSEQTMKPAAEILQEGLSILSERGKQYGSEGEERSFPQVAQAFTALTQAIALYATLMIMTCVAIWSVVEALAWVVC